MGYFLGFSLLCLREVPAHCIRIEEVPIFVIYNMCLNRHRDLLTAFPDIFTFRIQMPLQHEFFELLIECGEILGSEDLLDMSSYQFLPRVTERSSFGAVHLENTALRVNGPQHVGGIVIND